MPAATIAIKANVDSALRKGFSEASVRPRPETQMSAIIAGLENMGITVAVEDGMLVLAQGATQMHTGKALRSLATKPEFSGFFVQDGAHPSQWSKEKKIEFLRTHTDEEYRQMFQSPVLEAGVKTMDPNMSRGDYSQLTRAEKIAFLREFGSDAAARIMQKAK